MPSILPRLLPSRSTPSSKPQAIDERYFRPGDPLTGRMVVLDEFDKLLIAFNVAAEAVLEAVAKFAAAPNLMFQQLEDSAAKDGPGELVALQVKVHERLKKFAADVLDAAPLLDEMHHLVEKKRSMFGNIRNDFSEREAAWKAKVQCDEKCDYAMNHRTKRGEKPPGLVEEEKRARLDKSRANEEFQRCNADTEQALDGALDQKWDGPRSALSKLCRYYAAVFGSGQALARDFDALANSFDSVETRAQKTGSDLGTTSSWWPGGLLCCHGPGASQGLPTLPQAASDEILVSDQA